MLVMADIVDYVELTFSIKGDTYVQTPSSATVGAIVFFTFVFILVTLVIHRAETPGQKVRFRNVLPAPDHPAGLHAVSCRAYPIYAANASGVTR